MLFVRTFPQRARARVEDEKAEESSNPDSNADVLRIQAEVEKTTTEAEAAGIVSFFILMCSYYVLF